MARVAFLRIYSDEYYHALGRFLTEFTDVECALQKALWFFSKAKSPIAQAIFSGVRADDACGKITRIAEAENWSGARLHEWELIRNRVGILRILRNDILHYGANWQLDGTWIVTNKDYVHAAHKITETPVTVDILDDAIADSQKVGLHIFLFLYRDAVSEKASELTRPATQRSWRYKPPQQAGNRRNSPDNDPKPPRRPQPSSASRRKAALERSKNK